MRVSSRTTAILLSLWVACVLGHEAWATFDPSMRSPWLMIVQPVGGNLEFLPWITWAALPAAVLYRVHGPWLTREWFGFARWTRSDKLFLLGIVVAAVISIAVVRLVPSLAEYYRTLSSYGKFTRSDQTRYFLGSLAWILSWLPLWEFMTRGMLLPFVDKAFPKYGWLTVPALEFAFHLIKPWPEALGMLVFSLVATQWVRKRKNLMLPLLGHLAFELAVFGYVAYG